MNRTEREALASMRLEEANAYDKDARWALDNGRTNAARVLTHIADALRAEASKLQGGA